MKPFQSGFSRFAAYASVGAAGTAASHNKTAPRFFTVAAIGIALNSVLMFVLIHRLPLGWLAAQCITTACVLILTYGANSFWTFRTCKRERRIC